jgi:hypothetical protein
MDYAIHPPLDCKSGLIAKVLRTEDLVRRTFAISPEFHSRAIERRSQANFEFANRIIIRGAGVAVVDRSPETA